MPPQTRRSAQAGAAAANVEQLPAAATPGRVTRKRTALNAPATDRKEQEPQPTGIRIQATSTAQGAGQQLQGQAPAPTPTPGSKAHASTTVGTAGPSTRNTQQQVDRDEFIQQLTKKWQTPSTLQARVRKCVKTWLFRLDYILGAIGCDWWETIIVYSIALAIIVLVAYSTVKQLLNVLTWLASQPQVQEAVHRLWQGQ